MNIRDLVIRLFTAPESVRDEAVPRQMEILEFLASPEAIELLDELPTELPRRQLSAALELLAMAEEAEPVPIELELDAAVRDGDAQVAAAITRLLAELSDRGVTWPADILRDVGPLDLEAAMDAVSVLAYRKIRLEQAGKVRIEEGSEQSDRLPLGLSPRRLRLC